MHVGFASINAAGWDIPPAELGRTLEEYGYESLWLGEHSHIPASRRTPYPMGGDLPEAYQHMMDPYVTLMAAGAATTRLKLATGVALPLERDVFALAKEVATLDILTGGRVLFGVGAGWNVEQYTDHTDIPFSKRYRGLREGVEVLRALWTQDEAEFHGEFFDFDPVYLYPKPVQAPHPPVLAGFVGSIGVRHVAQWADGWCPIDIAFPGRDLPRGLRRLHKACADLGRDPATVAVTVMVGGDPEPDLLRRYRDLGIPRVVLGPMREGWTGRFTTLPFLQRYAPLIPELA